MADFAQREPVLGDPIVRILMIEKSTVIDVHATQTAPAIPNPIEELPGKSPEFRGTANVNFPLESPQMKWAGIAPKSCNPTARRLNGIHRGFSPRSVLFVRKIEHQANRVFKHPAAWHKKCYDATPSLPGIRQSIVDKEVVRMVAQGKEAGVVALGQARLAACPYFVLRSVLCEFRPRCANTARRIADVLSTSKWPKRPSADWPALAKW